MDLKGDVLWLEIKEVYDNRRYLSWTGVDLKKLHINFILLKKYHRFYRNIED